MLDRKSIYALNKKDSAAIVYIQADGQVIRLTRADFLTEEEFVKWKTWSDENYHDEEKRDHIYADHTLALIGLPDSVGAVPDAETILKRVHQRMEQKQFCALLVMQLKDILTPTQYRRLWMYYVDSLTEKEIAHIEGVGQRRISTSISDAKNKVIKYFFQKGQNKGLKSP